MHQKTLFRRTCADPERDGGLGVSTQPLDNNKAIGFLSNAGPDSLENHTATKLGHHRPMICWRADDGLLLVVLGSSIPSSKNKTKKQNKKTLLKLLNFLDPRMKNATYR